MAATDVAEKVLEHVRLRGPSTAKQVADALGVDRAIANNALYGPLRGKVQQSRDYTWSIAKAAPQVRE